MKMACTISDAPPGLRHGGIPSLSCQHSMLEVSSFASPSPTLRSVVFHRRPFSSITFARGRNRSSTASSSFSAKGKTTKISGNVDEPEVEEDAFEAIFDMLEEGLNNDEFSADDDEDITEEDMEMLQNQLEYALGIDYDDDNSQEPDDDNNEDDKHDTHPKLKTWQLRRLASALRTGRRKISIKSLSAEVCMDRAVVLKYLRDPPPSLLIMSAALPEEPQPKSAVPELKSVDPSPTEIVSSMKDGEPPPEVPIHAMRHQWSAQKRIKKAHAETLEMVYRRSKRPTNAMIASIVQLTNLPRRRVLKWFEDKRSEEGIPNRIGA